MDRMKVVVAGRRAGKTTKAIEWVEQGVRATAYPYWTRIIVTPTNQEADRLRRLLSQRAQLRGDLDLQGLQYNRVYAAGDWERMHIGRGWEGEIAIDNAEWLLREMFHQVPSLITMTGILLHDRDPRTI